MQLSHDFNMLKIFDGVTMIYHQDTHKKVKVNKSLVEHRQCAYLRY